MKLDFEIRKLDSLLKKGTDESAQNVKYSRRQLNLMDMPNVEQYGQDDQEDVVDENQSLLLFIRGTPDVMYGKNVGTRNYRTDFKAAKNDYKELKSNILTRKPKEIIEERARYKQQLWNNKI